MPSNPRVRADTPASDHGSKARVPAPQPQTGMDGQQATEGVTEAPFGLTSQKIAQLQRVMGNRHVARQISRQAAAPAPMRRPSIIQRGKDDPPGGGGAPDNQAALALAIKKIDEAPPVPEEALPDGDRVAEAIELGTALGSEVGAAQGNPGVAGAVADEAAATPDEAPPVPDQGAVAEFTAYVQSLSGGGDSGGGGESEASEESAGEAEAGGDEAAAGPARPTNQSKRYGNNAKTGAGIATSVGGIGSSLSGAGINIAKGVGATLTIAATAAATVLGYVAAGLGAIAAIFDFKSALSSRKAMKRLEVVMKELRAANPGDAQMISDIEYAINQKYSKAWLRATKAVTALTSAGIGIAVLATGVALGAIASNPVGWVIGAVIVGLCTVVGIGIIAYKLGHKLAKWYRNELGVRRRGIAIRLYDGMIGGDANAKAAVAALGLDAEKMILRAQSAETESAKEKRAKSAAGAKAVATLAESNAALKTSTNAAEEARIKVEQIKTRIAWTEANAAKGQHFGNKKQVDAELKKHRAELKKAEADFAKKQKLQAASEKKQAGDAIQVSWKDHSKKSREDIAFIEKKLKK